MSPEMIQLGAMIAGAVAVVAVILAIAYPYISGDYEVEKRVKGVTESRKARGSRVAAAEESSSRKQAVAETLKEIEASQAKKKKQSLRVKLLRAGLNIPVQTFWLASVGCGLAIGVAALVMMPWMPWFAIGCFMLIGTLGLPRWVVSFLTKRRQKKFLATFADAVDVIVRGVKSGLPLNECLGIIARESSEPIKSEFQEVVDQQRVGVPVAEALDRLTARMPLAEVRFFAIVIGIQQQAGGNLSEALGNLSGVLRARILMQAKVQALSAEAKASALVLGSLPPGVMTLVYITTPDYMSLLWTTKTGQFLVAGALVWVSLGIFIMRKMINFKY